MRHVFIINPRAGKRDQTSRILAMAEQLRRNHGLDCTCLLTQRPGGAREMAAALAATGQPLRVYACGGDGTVFEVANGLAGAPNAAMTCIPVGTGNDFLKNFGPDMARFSQAEALWDGAVTPLDLISCNGRLCVTIACCGIDARVAEQVHRFRGVPLLSGRGSYVLSVAKTALSGPIGRRWTVTLDGETETGDFSLLALCNGRYYGGGSTPVPEARMDDGVLHAITIRSVAPWTLARLFGAYSAGAYRSLPPGLVRVRPVREVRIQSETDIVTCLDGECFHSRDVTLTLADKRLNFFGPRGCDPNATAAVPLERMPIPR